LSLTKKIIEFQGGAIEVSSTWQQGSTFTVHLPLLAAPQSVRRSAAAGA
jgi:signal transduction histidine kinase